MSKCRTKTFVQVCRGADLEEMESGASKTAAQRRFCWVRPDCLHWKVKKEKYFEVRHAKHRWQRQNRELLNNLPLIGEVLDYSTLTTPKQWKTNKENRHKRSKKVFWSRDGGEFCKKNNEHIYGCRIFANHSDPRFFLFPSSPLPLDNNNSFIGIFQSCGKKNLGTMAGTRVLCTQYLLRVTIMVS